MSFLKTLVGKPMPKSMIKEYITTVNWQVDELFKQVHSPRCDCINDETIDKLLKLSGLSYPKDQYPKLIESLKEQVRFIDRLHAVDVEVEDSINANLYERLTLEGLKSSIESQQQDPSKGETLQSWDPMSLPTESQNGNYIVKEGLLKE